MYKGSFNFTLVAGSIAVYLTGSSLVVPVFSQDSASLPSLPSLSSGSFNSYSSEIPSETAYTLGAGDRIRMDLLQVPEMSGEYLVLVDGTISFPWIGSIKVKDLTISQLNRILTQKYAVYVKNPVLTTGLVAPRPVRIAIAGEINRPGTYTISLSERQLYPSLTEMIKQAGGLTSVADLRQVEIRRSSPQGEQVFNLNLLSLLEQGNLSQDVTLRDEDRIFIPTTTEINLAQSRQILNANFGMTIPEVDVAVVGEVYRPGSYLITGSKNDQEMRLPRLSFAIQQAGGIKPLADIRNIEIRRLTRTGSPQTFKIDLWQLLATGNLEEDAILQPGDTIIIPTASEIAPDEVEALASASFAPNTIKVNVVGEVTKPGTIELAPNTPLNQAVLAAGGFDPNRADTAEVELVRLNPNGTVSKRTIPINFANGINEENNPILRNNDVLIVQRNTVTTVTDVLETILSPFALFFRLF